MSFSALKEGFHLLKKYPVLWLCGLAAGAPLALMQYLSLRSDIFYAERVLIFTLIIYPFFLGAGYGVIKEKSGTLMTFIRQGYAYYFRVLLPSVLLFFGVLLVLFFVMLIVEITSGTYAAVFLALIVAIPLIFLAQFYDAAAVFEEKKVLESLQRSINVVLLSPGASVLFWILAAVLFFVILIFSSLLVSPLIGDVPTDINPADLTVATMTPEDISSLLGDSGVAALMLMYFFTISVFMAVFIPYKASFFLKNSAPVPLGDAPLEDGEFDEKGRWYKYS